jgi:2-polyprenyl-3-methyl-5-hydroxy-6-metoxy-1,4-benzoquinol methylase
MKPDRVMGADSAFGKVALDKVRDYWNSRPCNIRHSPSTVGTRQYFDEVEARKYFVEPHIPHFAGFNRWKGKKVLEIGCGIGTDTIRFARAGARVTAVDLSEESLSMARHRAEVFGLDTIHFVQANAEELSSYLPVERYDLVYSFGVIHHTPHPEKAIAEILKYMDNDSILKIMVYHRSSWKVFWMWLKYGRKPGESLDALIARYSEAETGCPVTYSYTRTTIGDLLKGFDILDMGVEHIFPYSIPDYLAYRYKKIWYFRWLPKALFRWMEHRWGWHLCVTAQKMRS